MQNLEQMKLYLKQTENKAKNFNAEINDLNELLSQSNIEENDRKIYEEKKSKLKFGLSDKNAEILELKKNIREFEEIEIQTEPKKEIQKEFKKDKMEDIKKTPKKQIFKKSLKLGSAKINFSADEDFDPIQMFGKLITTTRKGKKFNKYVNVLNENADTNLTDGENGYHQNADETVISHVEVNRILTNIAYQNLLTDSLALFVANGAKDLTSKNLDVAIIKRNENIFEFLGEVEPKPFDALSKEIYTKIKVKKIGVILRYSSEWEIFSTELTQAKLELWFEEFMSRIKLTLGYHLWTGDGEKQILGLLSSKRDGIADANGYTNLPVTIKEINSLADMKKIIRSTRNGYVENESFNLGIKNSVIEDAFVIDVASTTGGTDLPIISSIPGQINVYDLPGQGRIKGFYQDFSNVAAVNAGIIAFGAYGSGYVVYMKNIAPLYDQFSRSESNEIQIVNDVYMDHVVRDSERVFVFIDTFSPVKISTVVATATKIEGILETSKSVLVPNSKVTITKVVTNGTQTTQEETTDATGKFTWTTTSSVGEKFYVRNNKGEIIFAGVIA